MAFRYTDAKSELRAKDEEIQRLREENEQLRALAECEFADGDGMCDHGPDGPADCGWRVCGYCWNQLGDSNKRLREENENRKEAMEEAMAVLTKGTYSAIEQAIALLSHWRKPADEQHS